MSYSLERSIKKLRQGEQLRYFYCLDGSEDLDCEYDSVVCYFVSFNWSKKLMAVKLECGTIINTTLYHIQGF